MELFRRKMAARAIGIFIAWFFVLVAFVFMPGEVRFSSIKNTHEMTHIVVLEQYIGFCIAMHIKPSDVSRATYFFTISCFFSVVAYFYFLFTVLIVFAPPWSKFGKIIRFASFILLSVWSYPLSNLLYPTGHGPTSLEYGFYVMASGMTLAMCCILYCPRRPEIGPAFPVVEVGRKLDV